MPPGSADPANKLEEKLILDVGELSIGPTASPASEAESPINPEGESS
jgi:hypothetical protein